MHPYKEPRAENPPGALSLPKHQSGGFTEELAKDDEHGDTKRQHLDASPKGSSISDRRGEFRGDFGVGNRAEDRADHESGGGAGAGRNGNDTVFDFTDHIGMPDFKPRTRPARTRLPDYAGSAVEV